MAEASNAPPVVMVASIGNAPPPQQRQAPARLSLARQSTLPTPEPSPSSDVSPGGFPLGPEHHSAPDDDGDRPVMITLREGREALSAEVPLRDLLAAVAAFRGGGVGRAARGACSLTLEGLEPPVEEEVSEDETQGARTTPSGSGGQERWLCGSVAAMEVCGSFEGAVPEGAPSPGDADVAMPSDARVEAWAPGDVARWLRGIEALSSYGGRGGAAAPGGRPGVDGRALLRIRSRSDVERVLGVTLAVHQRLLLRELTALRARAGSASSLVARRGRGREDDGRHPRRRGRRRAALGRRLGRRDGRGLRDGGVGPNGAEGQRLLEE